MWVLLLFNGAVERYRLLAAFAAPATARSRRCCAWRAGVADGLVIVGGRAGDAALLRRRSDGRARRTRDRRYRGRTRRAEDARERHRRPLASSSTRPCAWATSSSSATCRDRRLHRPAIDAHPHAGSHDSERAERPDREREHRNAVGARQVLVPSRRRPSLRDDRGADPLGHRRHSSALRPIPTVDAASRSACGSSASAPSRSTSKCSRNLSPATGKLSRRAGGTAARHHGDCRRGRHDDRVSVADPASPTVRPQSVFRRRYGSRRRSRPATAVRRLDEPSHFFSTSPVISRVPTPRIDGYRRSARKVHMMQLRTLSVALIGLVCLWPPVAPVSAQKQEPPKIQIPQPGVPQIMTMEGKFVRAA